MPFVERENGKIIGAYSVEQAGRAEEWLPDDDPEVMALLNPPTPTPPLTARQLRLGLVLNGFELNQVEVTIDAIEDEADRALAKVEWEYASQFERDHPLLKQVGATLGLTEQQIDAMWHQARIL